uniref:Uncharacterized protein n=1 Tax=Oryza barthii TaxID=65489 RepID=A0A0D3HU05_9ORYZ
MHTTAWPPQSTPPLLGWGGLPSRTPGILRPSTKANKRVVRESHKRKANRTRCRDCHRPRLLIFSSSRRRIHAAQWRKATHQHNGGRLPIFLPLLRTMVDGSRAQATRTLGLKKKLARVLNTDDSPLCHCDKAKTKGAREPWSMKPASWTKVREDTLETMMVTRSRQSLGRTVKDETSHRVCQTPGQLETNARNGVANTWQLGDVAAMLEVEEEDPKQLTMTSADNEVVDARTARKTTRAAKLRSRGQHSYISIGENSIGGEATLSRAPLSVPTTSGGGPRAAALPRGRHSGNPKLDGVDTCSMTIGCKVLCPSPASCQCCTQRHTTSMSLNKLITGGHGLCYYHQLTNQPFGDRGDGLGCEDGGGIVADDVL